MSDAHRPAHSFRSIVDLRFARREVLRGFGAWAACAGLASRVGFTSTRAQDEAQSPGTPVPRSSLRFKELPHGADERMHVANEYVASVLIAFGDPLLEGAGPFDHRELNAARIELAFGDENDFLAFLPLPRGSSNSDHGLLCVNHESTAPHMLFPGHASLAASVGAVTRAEVEVEMAAHGHSVVEIVRSDGRWRAVSNSKYARRISARSTSIRLTGPAAGHPRLRTKDDPTGTLVLGTINNCSGGVTPWHSVLFCEENFNQYFHGDPSGTSEAVNHARCQVGTELEHGWHRFFERFEVTREPHEPNRFGWVVEYDPYAAGSTPRKLTALGRFKHEAATCVLAPDGRVVVYMGDDDEFEFVYKFVSKGVFDAQRPDAARDLLDEGTLFVARFDADGSVHWLALVHGTGPLTSKNGFASQADVLIEARRAGTLLGATRMDRPEDVETNPRSGHVYVILTNNKRRTTAETDAANPRAMNRDGQVVEIVPPKDVEGRVLHAADKATWNLFLVAGDPFKAPKEKDAVRPRYAEGTTSDGWLACPDNCAFDPAGRMWIATDGQASHQLCDSVYAVDTAGSGRAAPRHFFRAPLGAEICGPAFTPDGTTLFVSIQHPGSSDASGGTRGVAYATPTTRFPDFDPDRPPRSAVVAIVKKDGGVIGG